MIRSHTGTPPTGTRSLAALLAKDGSGFDKNWSDYDILDNAVGAVGAVLAAKPKSPVAVLALKGATIKVKVRCWVVILKDNDPQRSQPDRCSAESEQGQQADRPRHQPVLRPVDL